VSGNFNDRCGLGFTVGEEVLFQESKKRLETVKAMEDSCLMQIKVKDFELMTSKLLKVGAGLTFIEDHMVLM
jgi:CRP-like cAMP-binding protein